MLICNNVIQHYFPPMKNVLCLLGANNEIGEKTLRNHIQEINALTDKQIETFQLFKISKYIFLNSNSKCKTKEFVD